MAFHRSTPMSIGRWTALVHLVLLALLHPSLALAPQLVSVDGQRALQPSEADAVVVSSLWPSFSWQLQSEPAAGGDTPARNVTQVAYRLQLQASNSSRLCRCPSSPPPVSCAAWDSGRISSPSTLHRTHPTAPHLLPDTSYAYSLQYWSSTGAVSDSTSGTFRTSLSLSSSSFNLTRGWSGPPPTWVGHTSAGLNDLRREFSLPSPPSRAVLYWSGLGYSRLRLNGGAVDPTRRLDPGTAPYDLLVPYTSVDVTGLLLHPGVNALAAQLGHGWYSAEQYPRGAAYPSYGPPRLWAELRVEYADCAQEPTALTTDLQWTGRRGAVVHDSVYHGEVYDARLETDSSVPGFTDPSSLWLPVQPMPAPAGALVYQSMPPVRAGSANLAQRPLHAWPSQARLGRSVTAGGEVQPVEWWSPDQLYTRVFDLGQVMAGWARVCTDGARGSSVRVVYGEVLEPVIPFSIYDTRSGNGSFVYTSAHRSSAGGDVYLLRGSNASEPECYEPQMTYHGFRFVQLLGVPTNATATVTGVRVHSATEVRGVLSTRHAVVDQLHQNLQWALLSNAMSLPTDCPQRDERQGWMGDAALSVDLALYQFDLTLFYENFLRLIRAVQADDGSVPDTVPFTRGFWPAEAAWGSAYPTIAWRLWQHSGDRALLRGLYPGLQRWLAFLLLQSERPGGLHQLDAFFADWLPPPPWSAVNGSLVSAYALLHDLRLLAAIAAVCDEADDAAGYGRTYARLAGEFHAAFFNASLGAYGTGEQTADVLALSLPDVVPASLRPTVVAHLVQSLTTVGHLTTGVVGTSRLFDALSESAHHSLAVQQLLRTGYPGYAFMFSNAYENATALWEGWDVPFRGPEMSSRNHHMLASVGAWLYRSVAGIQMDGADTAGRLRVIIHPRWVEDAAVLPDVLAEYASIAGPIRVELHRTSAAVYSLAVDIPPGVVAAVVLEASVVGATCEQVVEGNTTLWRAGQVNATAALRAALWDLQAANDSSSVRFMAGSGRYAVTAVWALPEPAPRAGGRSTGEKAVVLVASIASALLVAAIVGGVCARAKRRTAVAAPLAQEPLLTKPALQ